MLDLPATDKKLGEAHFFVDHFRRASLRVVGEREEEFFLSAFLSAARAVTLVLQKEQKRITDYESWFRSWRAKLSKEDDELLDHMNKQRVASFHKTGPELTTGTEFIPVSQLPPSEGTFYSFGPPGTPEPTAGRQVLSFFPEGGERAVATCQRYLALLDRIIHDFKNM